MTKRQKMLANIEKHAAKLLVIFPAAKLQGYKLSAKLRSLETKVTKITESLCNYSYSEEETTAKDKEIEKVLESVCKLLGIKNDNSVVFINRDPRGYALKVYDTYVKANKLEIHKDFGGYGVLAPNLSE